MQGLQSNNVVKLLEFIIPSCNALVMEFCSGGSLLDYLEKQKEPISWELRLRFAEKILILWFFFIKRKSFTEM